MDIEPTGGIAARIKRVLRIAGLAWLTLALGPVPAAMAQTPSFAGKTISVLVPASAGGGYDAYARLAARHLARFLPGTPTIVVQNMPGAGGLVEANWLSNVAPSDGTAIGIVLSSNMFEPLLGNSHAKFDLHKVKWLASLSDLTPVAIVRQDTPFKRVEDLMTHEALTGGAGAAADLTVWPKLLNALIGTKFKVVTGYSDSAGISLALERGEVQAFVGDDWDSLKTNHAAWLRDHKVRILMQMHTTRHPDLPNVPTALEFAKGDAHEVLQLFIARQTFGRPFIAPPGTAAPIVAVYRQGFARMVIDPAFQEDAKRINLHIQPASGEEITALVDKVAGSPPTVIAKATAVMKQIDPER